MIFYKKGNTKIELVARPIIHLVMATKDFMEGFLVHAGGGCLRSGDSELWQDHREAQDQKSRNKRPEGQILAEDKN